MKTCACCGGEANLTLISVQMRRIGHGQREKAGVLPGRYICRTCLLDASQSGQQVRFWFEIHGGVQGLLKAAEGQPA